MIRIECEEPITQVCECCGGLTTRLTRFVYRDGYAFAVYYAIFANNHPEREVKLAVSLGEWGEDSKPEERCSFALVMCETVEEYQVRVIDADESPWKGMEIIGPMLNRDEGLAHPWIKDVFHITDHMVIDDPAIKEYFEAQPLTNASSGFFRPSGA